MHRVAGGRGQTAAPRPPCSAAPPAAAPSPLPRPHLRQVMVSTLLGGTSASRKSDATKRVAASAAAPARVSLRSPGATPERRDRRSRSAAALRMSRRCLERGGGESNGVRRQVVVRAKGRHRWGRTDGRITAPPAPSHAHHAPPCRTPPTPNTSTRRTCTPCQSAPRQCPLQAWTGGGSVPPAPA